jgi:bifunctional DNase/RNase
MRALIVTATVLVACGGAAVAPAPPPPLASKPVERGEPAGIPDGYIDAHVLQILERDEGAAVLLLDESTMLVLPIFIGGTEAASIALRIRGVAPQRPLTHDLLDTIVKRLHAQIVKVQVDTLRDGVFYGSVFLRVDHRIIKLDARPSDALALAIGNKVPIYVAKAVMQEAGVPRDEILRQLTPAVPPPTT